MGQWNRCSHHNISHLKLIGCRKWWNKSVTMLFWEPNAMPLRNFKKMFTRNCFWSTLIRCQIKNKHLNKFLKLKNFFFLIGIRGSYMTKEENKQFRKVYKVVVLVSPRISSTCFCLFWRGRMQSKHKGKDVVYQLTVVLEDWGNGAAKRFATDGGGKKSTVECLSDRIHQLGPWMIQQIQSVYIQGTRA